MVRPHRLAAFFSCFAVACSASHAPENPVDDVLGVALPLGWAANLAMAAFEGQAIDCVELVEACAGDACLEDIQVRIDASCPLPLLDGAQGSIGVDGVVLEPGLAFLSFDFREVDVGGQQILRDRVWGTLVDFDSEGVEVSWASEWLDWEDDGIGIDQNAWTAQVERVGEDANPLEDPIVCSGASQLAWAGIGGEVVQVALGDATFVPDCGWNPVSGSASWSEAGTLSLGLQQLSFHPACDGSASTIGLYWGDLELSLVR